MKKLSAFLCLLVAGFLLFGCDPSDDPNSGNGADTAFAKNFGAKVNRNFFGQVVDADNNPIQNATIKIGTATTQTDAKGVFMLRDAKVYEKFAYITAAKTGYVDGSRSLVPTSGTNSVKITLLQSGDPETVQSGQTSEVSIYSGTKVKFDGAFEDADGNAYTGSVGVFLFHLTPSNHDIASLQPGMLYGQREDGSPSAMQTFGMLNVELRGSAGQKLQIAKGHTAEITMRIDDDQLATAAATIPLWHFDEKNGWWKEDGFATRNDNYYVGNVSHFSWWNLDVPGASALVFANVKDTQGHPVSGTAVYITTSDGLSSSTVITDSEGNAAGFVFANTNLTINAVACDASVSQTQAGPFAPNSVNTVNVVISQGNSQTAINASVENCQGNPVAYGYIQVVSSTGIQYYPFENGQINSTFLFCNPNQTFQFNVNDALGNVQSFELTAGQVQNLTHILVCDAQTEYVTYSIDGQDPIVLSGAFDAGQNNGINGFNINSSSTAGSLVLVTNTTLPGIYDTSHYSIAGSITINNSVPNTVLLGIVQYGAVGEFIDCTLNGTVTNESGAHTIQGSLHVKRDH